MTTSAPSGTKVGENNDFWQLTLKHMYLIEENNDGRTQKPSRVDQALEQNK